MEMMTPSITIIAPPAAPSPRLAAALAASTGALTIIAVTPSR